jgi:hypothetical protein
VGITTWTGEVTYTLLLSEALLVLWNLRNVIAYTAVVLFAVYPVAQWVAVGVEETVHEAILRLYAYLLSCAVVVWSQSGDVPTAARLLEELEQFRRLLPPNPAEGRPLTQRLTPDERMRGRFSSCICSWTQSVRD